MLCSPRLKRIRNLRQTNSCRSTWRECRCRTSSCARSTRECRMEPACAVTVDRSTCRRGRASAAAPRAPPQLAPAHSSSQKQGRSSELWWCRGFPSAPLLLRTGPPAELRLAECSVNKPPAGDFPLYETSCCRLRSPQGSGMGPCPEAGQKAQVSLQSAAKTSSSAQPARSTNKLDTLCHEERGQK